MKFPQMNKQPARTVSVPDLAGGVNKRDSVSSVLDNQLTDCLNVWYQDGSLHTRPGFKTAAELCVPLDMMYLSYKPTVKVLDIYKTADGQSKRLVMHYTADIGASYAYFNWVGGNAYTSLPGIVVYYKMDNIFVVQFKDEIYAFICGDGNYDIYKLAEDESGWNLLENTAFYVPTILTNCVSSLDNTLFGDTNESINILSDYVKYEMSSVNLDLLSSLSDFMDYHYMSYGLYYPDKGKTDFSKLAGKTVTVEIGGVEHKVTLNSQGYGIESDYNSTDSLKLSVKGLLFEFTTLSGDGTDTSATVTVSDFSHNNMTVTQPIARSTEDLDKIFLSTQTEWFGGASAGLAGGTRLFLCGNKKEKNRSLLVWSGLDNPLYFPLNGYAHVGNSNSGLTGFGKQSNMLVLFKRFETFYTYYVQDSDAVYFPIVQINSSIGCDMPDTIQLCRNRLVWTNSDGRVYTLVSNNQHSERNIFLVSDMIHSTLKSDPNLAYAAACDWNGYYVLFCKSNVYLMNYDSYGYQYVTSYTKNEDANLHIPWYVWQLPQGQQATNYSASTVFTIANRLCYFGMLSEASLIGRKPTAVILYADESYHADDMAVYDVELDALNKIMQLPITCSVTTKMFDFSAPNKRKNIMAVGLSLGVNDGVPINVRFVSDDGEEEYPVEITAPPADVHTPSYVQSVIMNPGMRGVVRFGVKLECDGFMSLDGMTVTYKMLGGAR